MHSTITKQMRSLRLRIRSILFVFIASAVMAGMMSPAQAETITAEAHATSMGDIDLNDSVDSVVVNNLDANGKLVGAWVSNPGPRGHWSPAKAKQVRFASSYDAGVRTCRPFRLKKGQWMPRTLKKRDGVIFQVKGGTHVKYAWSLFDQGKTCSDVRHRGFYNTRKHTWQGDCLNPKPTPDMPSYPASMVVEVVQHTAINYDVALNWLASAWVYGSVSVTCPKSSATSSFQAKGSTEGKLTLHVSARTSVEAEAEARRQLALSIKSSTQVKSDIMVSGEVSAEGTAKASCTTDETPTYTVPAASGNAQACVKPGQQNGVITASGTNPNNVAAPGTLTVGGKTQQFSTVGAGQTVSFDFSGYAPGTYNGTFTLGAPISKSVAFQVTVQECVYQNGSIIEVTDVNDVRYGSTYFWRIRGTVPDGQSAVLRVSAGKGTVKDSDKSIPLGAGAFDVTIQYTAPTEGSSDTLTASLLGPDGVQDDQKSDTFNLLANPTDPAVAAQ